MTTLRQIKVNTQGWIEGEGQEYHQCPNCGNNEKTKILKKQGGWLVCVVCKHRWI